MLPKSLEKTPMSYSAELRLTKGFIMHKMYHLGYTSGAHTSIDNLPKSCPDELRPFVDAAIRELKRERLLVPKPTSYGQQVTVQIAPTGFDYANAYRRKYGIPEEQYGKPQKQQKTQLLSMDVLRSLKLKKKR